jgi:hypothetical protein
VAYPQNALEDVPLDDRPEPDSVSEQNESQEDMQINSLSDVDARDAIYSFNTDSTLRGVLNRIIHLLNKFLSQLQTVSLDIAMWTYSKVQTILESAANWFRRLWSWLKEQCNAVIGVVKEMYTSLKEDIESFVTGFKDALYGEEHEYQEVS